MSSSPASRRCSGAGGPGELPAEQETIAAGELAIRPDRFDAYVGEEAAGLSRKEYELLLQLATAEGRVLEREEIYQRVWGYTMVRGDRSVDVFVRKLRQKLERLSPELALRPHPLRGRVPVCGRAARRDAGTGAARREAAHRDAARREAARLKAAPETPPVESPPTEAAHSGRDVVTLR